MNNAEQSQDQAAQAAQATNVNQPLHDAVKLLCAGLKIMKVEGSDMVVVQGLVGQPALVKSHQEGSTIIDNTLIVQDGRNSALAVIAALELDNCARAIIQNAVALERDPAATTSDKWIDAIIDGTEQLLGVFPVAKPDDKASAVHEIGRSLSMLTSILLQGHHSAYTPVSHMANYGVRDQQTFVINTVPVWITLTQLYDAVTKAKAMYQDTAGMHPFLRQCLTSAMHQMTSTPLMIALHNPMYMAPRNWSAASVHTALDQLTPVPTAGGGIQGYTPNGPGTGGY